MKAIICIILTFISIQSTLAQKVDWNKPLYKVEIHHELFYFYNPDDSLPHDMILGQNQIYYKIYDTLATYIYVGDTMIVRQLETKCKNTKTYINGELVNEYKVNLSHLHHKILDSMTTYKYQGDTMIVKEFITRVTDEKSYIDDKIIEERDYGWLGSYGDSHLFYTYDSLGSLSNIRRFYYRERKIEKADTIQYVNKYDTQNRLIGIIGTDKKNLKIKYRNNKKIEISHTPKDKYRKVYYYKDPNYQNDTLIVRHTWRGNEYRRTEYDSINRYTLIEKWSDYGSWLCGRGMYEITYQYVDNIKIISTFDIDTIWRTGIIYKKEE